MTLRFLGSPFRLPPSAFRLSSSAFLLLVLAASPAQAEPPAAARPELKAAENLMLEQQQIADRYKHLEEVLLRMAELTASTDPHRAALLKKAVAQSKEQLIGVQFEKLVDVLQKEQLSRAIDNQTELDKDLRSLLQLLLSENRAKRLESEKARIQQYLKQLGQLIKDQKSLQGRAASGGELKNLSPEQLKVADRTGGLSRQIKDNEETSKVGPGANSEDKQKPGGKEKGGPPSAQPKPAGAQPGQPDAKSHSEKEKSPSPGKSSESRPSPASQKGQPEQKSQPGPDGKPGQKGQPGQKSPSGAPAPQGQPSPSGEAQDQDQPDAQQNPAREKLQEAEKAMREAQQKLAAAKKNDAVAKQEEAIRELERAKAALEEILRQLRQEEKERTLAMLEVRFAKMLKMQREVYEGTVRLDKVSEKDRTHNHEIESGRLSSKEVEIVVEADKATLLLHDDGSAVAFPEAVRQMRQDMQQIVGRLSEAKVGKITQGLEKDVIGALEEMLDALKRAQKDLEDRKQRPQRAGEPQTPALVDLLAELKMIRALQVRVNGRTQRYAKLVEGEQASGPDLIEALKRLAENQQRIYKITRDLELGKNR
jgi:hypothetical protein